MRETSDLGDKIGKGGSPKPVTPAEMSVLSQHAGARSPFSEPSSASRQYATQTKSSDSQNINLGP